MSVNGVEGHTAAAKHGFYGVEGHGRLAVHGFYGVEGRSRGAVGGFNGVGTVFGVASSHFPGTKSPAGGSEHACVRCETANEVSEHGG